ncbi:MAG: ribonuclease P protein component [Candidatus Latescibacteria bacterium]|nr:ribonuclease P protein component [Candidatus Latescibacterota bacterium]NIM22661.1 ribonuclease P protein component [Candidatus Latescibacterota bacterium]NIM64950.1 ribonuclease P protein component [Candidatus Latescibacterota bacterium]NIO01465.1 ribonuclease P protein component [Candidatus Latescibacterota bacterium]NIO27975.1 ribonuclease P protein component [Candidatus Latescibacterota bacterium]
MALKVLQKNWQFQVVYRQGKKIICKHAIVFYHRCHLEGENPRFGFVASKRVGSAVKRNRAKRILKEAFRQISKELEHQNFWIVAVAKASIGDATYQETLMDLRERLAAGGLLKDEA